MPRWSGTFKSKGKTSLPLQMRETHHSLLLLAPLVLREHRSHLCKLVVLIDPWKGREQNSDKAWDEAGYIEFSEDLCRLFVACGIAWNAADNTEMWIFLEKWIPGVWVPRRCSLAGRFLDREVEKVESWMKDIVAGKDGTIQCDGWKNVAKTPVTTSVMMVEKEVNFENWYKWVLLTFFGSHILYERTICLESLRQEINSLSWWQTTWNTYKIILGYAPLSSVQITDQMG